MLIPESHRSEVVEVCRLFDSPNLSLSPFTFSSTYTRPPSVFPSPCSLPSGSRIFLPIYFPSLHISTWPRGLYFRLLQDPVSVSCFILRILRGVEATLKLGLAKSSRVGSAIFEKIKCYHTYQHRRYGCFCGCPPSRGWGGCI